METTADSSRTTNRISPTKDTAFVHGLISSPVLAAVIDECFGGIGIAVPLKLADGDGAQELAERELTVEYGGVSCVAVVRHVAAMQSGCRLGLEWKAQALSRCLRDLLKLQPKAEEELGRFLPGGLSMMWKLCEADRWHFLLDSTDRLRRQVSICGMTELREPIERFQAIVREIVEQPGSTDVDVVADASTRAKVRDGLNELIRNCIAAIS